MLTKAKLLSACITLLIVLANAQTEIKIRTEFDAKIVFWKSLIPFIGPEFVVDNLQKNNFILYECRFLEHLKRSCDVVGSPTDETTLQRCNLTISTVHSNTSFTTVDGVYRFKDNTLIAIVTDSVYQEKPSLRDYKHFTSFQIFDNSCVPVNVVSPASSKDGKALELHQIVIYEDGFDIVRPGSRDENAEMHYQSFDTDGKQIGDYTVLPEQLPYRVPRWNPKWDLKVIFAKRHSRGVVFSSGYHFYPNGSIFQFADDQFAKIMRSFGVANVVDDGPFYTACASLRHSDKDIGCWQYDVDHARLVVKAKFDAPRNSGYHYVRNLSKGGFLYAFYGPHYDEDSAPAMTIYVIRPDRPDFIDRLHFDVNDYEDHVNKISDFDETTGKITVFRRISSESSIVHTRSSYFLKNYVST